MDFFLNSNEYKIMKELNERTVFKLIGKYCFNTGDKILEKSAAEINEYYKNKKITLEYVEQTQTKKGTTISTTKELSKNYYQIWSEDPTMKEYLEIVFNCDIKNVKPTQYNLFDGFNQYKKIETKKVNLEPIFEHIRSLVNFNEDHYNYVISWLAQLIQQPHILPHTTLIFISEEGVGKDLFSKFISTIINDKYTLNTEKLENICGKFNSSLGGKLLITINETNPIESRERIENIKYLITADKIAIEGKHKDPIKSDNFCRFIFFSNRLFAFPVEENSRRPKIFQSSNKYLPKNFGSEENKKYFTNLAENIYKNIDYQKAFLEYLKSYDISNFNPKMDIKSELHQELEDASINPVGEFLIEYMRKLGGSIRVLTTELYNEFKTFLTKNSYKYDYSPKKFNVEIVATYKIKKIKNSNQYFEINYNELKELLTKKYKCEFDKIDENILDFGLENTEDKKDKEIIELKKQLELLQNEINKLKSEKSDKKEKKNKAVKSLSEDELLELELQNLLNN